MPTRSASRFPELTLLSQQGLITFLHLLPHPPEELSPRGQPRTSKSGIQQFRKRRANPAPTPEWATNIGLTALRLLRPSIVRISEWWAALKRFGQDDCQVFSRL